jgi:gamma-glutamylaminecyclotransferase
MGKTKVFVYGTLKRGGRSHHLLDGQEFLGPARTRPAYRLYDRGSYPCLVEDWENGVPVQGEVWRVDDETLQRLDAYEGLPGLYCRKEIALEEFPGAAVAYFFNGDVSGFTDCGGHWPVG